MLLSLLFISERLNININDYHYHTQNKAIDECTICKDMVTEIEYQLLLNGSDTRIAEDISYICKSSQYCEFILPMIVNKFIHFIFAKGNTTCYDLHVCQS